MNANVIKWVSDSNNLLKITIIISLWFIYIACSYALCNSHLTWKSTLWFSNFWYTHTVWQTIFRRIFQFNEQAQLMRGCVSFCFCMKLTMLITIWIGFIITIRALICLKCITVIWIYIYNLNVAHLERPDINANKNKH